MTVGEPEVGAVVVCLRDGARVGLIGVRGVGLLVKVIVGPLVGLYEGFNVGFEVGEREDGRIVGFLERETVGFCELVGRRVGFTELGTCVEGMVVAIAIGD